MTLEELTSMNFSFLISEHANLTGCSTLSFLGVTMFPLLRYSCIASVDGFDRYEFALPWLLQLKTKPTVHLLVSNSVV